MTDRTPTPPEDVVARVFTTHALEGRRVLVTGGTRGIGRAIALALAGAGGTVTATWAARESDADDAAAALRTYGGEHAVRRCDVRDAQAIATLFAELKDRGGVDVLVNNAAIARDAHLMMLSDDAWDDVLATNLTGPFLCARRALRPMIAQRWGRIVNVISPAGLVGKAGAANYAASKGGLLSMTRSLAREVARFGITVNAVCPGIVETPMLDAVPTHVREEMIGHIPLGRTGRADEVAAAVLFLTSPAASYITGAMLAVDGGLVMA